ncbi:MAG: hypothetical protein Kow0099_02610 [Candidatus Abyssubacteria bacterium]
MIVKCIRCNSEFASEHSQTHVCPHCHFVFSENDQPGLEIVRSHDLVRQRTGHRLTEETEAKCSFHPDADAIHHCKRCGRPLCYACAIEAEDGFLCEVCDTVAEVRPGPAEPPFVAAPPKPSPPAEPKDNTVSQALIHGPYVPWEYRRYIGRVNALFATWHQTLLSPLSFFRGVPITGDYRSPLTYGLFWTLVGLAGGAVWKLFFAAYPTILLFFEGEPVQLSFQLSDAYMLALAAVVLSPLMALVMLVIACSIYHIFVILFTSRHAGYEATLRVVCYSTGTNVFYFLPLVGGLLGGIWQLVLVTAGLKEVHRISFPLALLIALFPYTFVLILGFAFMLWAVSGGNADLSSLFEILRSLLE